MKSTFEDKQNQLDHQSAEIKNINASLEINREDREDLHHICEKTNERMETLNEQMNGRLNEKFNKLLDK
jgi:uncharacterized FlaG/YvyC family protein